MWSRIVRAIVLSALAALILSTNVFVTADRVRVQLVQGPVSATTGQVSATTAGVELVNALRPPFALITRIDNQSAETAGAYTVAVDGVPVCERSVASGGARRVDCAVTGDWNPAIAHEVTILGPRAAWTVVSLELATHHGATDGAHYLLVLPAASDDYVRPALVWVIAAWCAIAALLLLPAPPPLPRWAQRIHIAVAALIVLELAIGLGSRWISDYRIVMHAGTFMYWMILLLAPRIWATGRWVARTAALCAEFRPTPRATWWLSGAFGLALVGLVAWQLVDTRPDQATAHDLRQALRDELRPVTLKNCTLGRFGGPNDGGYVMCENLIAGAQSAYSYGIAGEDNWGCDVSTRFGVPVHQYDCFDTRTPVCTGGRFVFHAECIGDARGTIESRLFDTLTNQIAGNGDAGRRLVVKMDVEGAEWDSLLATPDSVLDRIEQLPMELHGINGEQFVAVVQKLKRTFHLVHVHFNNMACTPNVEPFPAYAYQVLFVNKRIGIPDLSAPMPTLPRAVDAPDNPAGPDCQSPLSATSR